jgi:hypothetical protein
MSVRRREGPLYPCGAKTCGCSALILFIEERWIAVLNHNCRVRISILSLLLLIFIAAGVVLAEEMAPESAPLPEKIQLRFFHDTACGSCDGTEEFLEILGEALNGVRDMYPYTLYMANVFQSTGRDEFVRVTDEIGLSRENLEFPLMIVNSKVYQGLESIRNNAREAFLTAGEDIFVNQYVYWPSRDKDKPLFERYSVSADHATTVYFYRTTCEECNSIKPFMDDLPQTVMIDGQSVPLDVVRINTRSGNNGERIYAFFDAYQVPPEDQTVPIIFLSSGYISGAEAIKETLINRLEAGEGLGFTFP